MRRSQAAKYAQWSAAAAMVLTLAVAGVYAYRAWWASEARRDAPPAVPPSVRQQAAEFTFSKLEGGRKLFTVRASRTTEFAEGNLNRLEDVRITVYGRRGDRFDKIRTRACDYDPGSGNITCAGSVEISLAPAAAGEAQSDDWSEIAPSPYAVQVQTSHVTFDSESGLVRTDRPVLFTFPGGSGRGAGVFYDTRAGIVRLHDGVELAVAAPEVAGGETIQLSGAGLEFVRAASTLQLKGPVQARQGNRLLTAGTLLFELDSAFRVRKAYARGAPQLQLCENGRTRMLRAAEFTASLSPAGGLEGLLATGDVSVSTLGAGAAVQFSSDRLAIEFEKAQTVPRFVTLAGRVRGQSARFGQKTQFETELLRVVLEATVDSGMRIVRAESTTAAALEWSTDAETLRVTGQKLQARFDEANHLRELAGQDGVEIARHVAGGGNERTAQVSRSHEFLLRLVPDGGWSQLEQTGQVRFREGALTAQAEHARFTQADGSAALTGNAVVTDGSTRIAADRFEFHQRSGEIRAEGSVRTSHLAPGNDSAAHIAAASLQANRQSGRAVYSGRARLWQGASVIESNRIELDRTAQQLLAEGRVRALFAEGEATGRARPHRLWRVQAARMVYRGKDGLARFEDNVSAESGDTRVVAPSLELQLSAVPGERRILRATAEGGVTVRQGGRRATAARAVYFAEDEKFVLSGGTPTIYDGLGNTVSGAELTFYFASDTIFVKSEDGSRTLTRYRVER